MKVRCIRTSYPEGFRKSMGFGNLRLGQQETCVEEGEELTVTGLTAGSKGTVLDVAPANWGIVPHWWPLFEVIDDRVSEHWRLEVDEEGTLHIFPACYDKWYVQEDISEGPGALERHKRLISAMELEGEDLERYPPGLPFED